MKPQFMYFGIWFVVAVFLTGCGGSTEQPTPTITNAPASPGLPDLTISYESEWDECSSTEFFLSITVTNKGSGEAASFLVFANQGEPLTIDGLAVGESITIDVARTMFLNAIVDVDEMVTELDESNNELTLFGGTGSRPCFTPTP
jgi:subtilase family serine protease